MSTLQGRERESFGDLAFTGRNALWRYALTIVLVVAAGTVGTVIVARTYVALGWMPGAARLLNGGDVGIASLEARVHAFVLLMASLIVFLPGLALIPPALHRRPWRSFLTAAPALRVRRMAVSAGWMFALLAAAALLQWIVAPQGFKIEARMRELWLFAALAFALVPFQVLTEEVFFRGYLTQAVGRLTPRPALRLAIPALFFTLAHWQNPEAQHGAAWAVANYALAALYLGWLALKDNGLEAALGAHFAINIFVVLVAGPADSVSPSGVILREIAPDYRVSFVSSLALFALHHALLFPRRKARVPPPAKS